MTSQSDILTAIDSKSRNQIWQWHMYEKRIGMAMFAGMLSWINPHSTPINFGKDRYINNSIFATNAGRFKSGHLDLRPVDVGELLKVKTSKESELESNFNRLAKKWKDETRNLSSVGSMVMHPAYLEIISYGEKIIPYILKDLQNKPSHWFIALKTLAKYSPVKPEDAGNIKKMTEAWIEWGKANGKLS